MITLEYLRTFRIGEYAIFDLTVSFLGVMLLAPLLSKLFRLIHLEIPLSSWLYLTLPIGVLAHILVANHTLMTKYFLDPTDHYPLKLFIALLVYLGIRGISLIK